MPAQSKGQVIQRQWELLRLIPSHDLPGRTAADLSAALSSRGYEVTRRTVERDLDGLALCMPLECNERKRPQRWRWQKTRGLDVPGMEVAEAMALYMMKDAMTQHLPSCFIDALHGRFVQANKTLGLLARAGANARWSDLVRVVPAHVTLVAPRILPKIMQPLQKALLNEIAIDASYQSLKESAPTSRMLYPRALLLRGSSLYLIAHQKGTPGEPRHYAVQRLAAVRLRELEPWPDGPFSLDAFLKDGKDQFGDGRSIQFTATIRGGLEKILHDSPLSDDMTIEESGGVLTLTATVRDTWALRSWILSHAENIHVRAPAALRSDIAKRAKEAAAQYE
jgi:predicted DNA-binding transcriptional regulator YafY